MADWAAHEPVLPGAKVYLFTGLAGNALDFLVTQAVTGAHHRRTLHPPLTPDMLTVMMGLSTERQVTVIREIESFSVTDWELVDKYLTPAKVSGQSLVLVGSHAIDAPARVRRQAMSVDVSDPTGPVGRAALERWVVREWRTSPQAANAACLRADYSIERLFWGWRTWRAVTQDKTVTGSMALRLITHIVPESAVDWAYKALLERRPVPRLTLTPDETLSLLRRLESALSDLTLIAPVLNTGASVRMVMSKTGVHVVRVMALTPLVARYPAAALRKCRVALAFGFAHFHQPGVASVVANLWG